jgi:hypothetical protein
MKTNNQQLAMGFLSLAYRDYLASRFLLNYGFSIQGAVLASSAVEKYLKIFLALHDIKKKVHLDKLEKLRDVFSKIEYNPLFDKFDPNFFEILGKVYKYRYYDETTVTHADTVGFIVHQFLGELDFTVFLLNNLITMKDDKGNIIKNNLQRDTESSEGNLYLNNYILNEIPKKEFMSKSGNAFGLHINPKFLGMEIEITGQNVRHEYNGRMLILDVSNK